VIKQEKRHVNRGTNMNCSRQWKFNQAHTHTHTPPYLLIYTSDYLMPRWRQKNTARQNAETTATTKSQEEDINYYATRIS